MRMMTIVECIKKVLAESSEAMTAKEIYEEIVKQNLYAFGAQDPVSVVNAQIRRRCAGLDFPTAYNIKSFEIEQTDGKKVKYKLLSGNRPLQTIKKAKDDSEKLPEEAMGDAFLQHITDLKQRIRDLIASNTPEFFEHLVVELLLKMGYGYDEHSGKVTGRSHDGGIDGIISEDKLGLGLIYIQAKRYSKANKVGRKEIQAFVGAMEHIQKGVFITTSAFTREAITFAEKQQQKSIKLIDGDALTDLIIRNEIGIQPVYKYTVYKVDSDYYRED